VHEMKRLILVRHARATHQPGPDPDRWLTDEGMRDAALLGSLIADHVVGPAVALVSAAKRARQTWEQCSTAMPLVKVHWRDGLYGAVHGPQAVLEAIREAQDRFATVIVIAHNPGLEDVVRGLLGAAALSRNTLPTAGFVTVDVTADWQDFEPRTAQALGLEVARSQT
jgi:phosphohistidine phosphatase